MFLTSTNQIHIPVIMVSYLRLGELHKQVAGPKARWGLFTLSYDSRQDEYRSRMMELMLMGIIAVTTYIMFFPMFILLVSEPHSLIAYRP